MAEKVKKLNLDRDYKKYLYYIDGEGNVCHKSKSGEGESRFWSRMPSSAITVIYISSTKRAT